jgi:hypothetical protein
MGNHQLEQLQDPTILSGDEGRSRSIPLLAGLALGISGAIFAIQSCEGEAESHEVTVEKQEVIALEGNMSTTLLTPVVRSQIELKVNWDSPDLEVPFSPFAVGPPDTESTYRAYVPGDYDLSVTGIVATINRVVSDETSSSTTTSNSVVTGEDRSAEDTKSFNQNKVDMDALKAQPEDEVIVVIDRSKLFQNRIRVDSSLNDMSYVVKDGKVIKRNGEKVEPPEVIFAEDGEYVLEKADITGQDAALTDFYEGLTLGNTDIGKNAINTIAAAAQIATGNPECLESITEQVPLDDAVERSVRESLIEENGFVEEQIKVEFVDEWPEFDEIEDENGKTFAERNEAFERAVPGGMKISFESDCRASEVKG